MNDQEKEALDKIIIRSQLHNIEKRSEFVSGSFDIPPPEYTEVKDVYEPKIQEALDYIDKLLYEEWEKVKADYMIRTHCLRSDKVALIQRNMPINRVIYEKDS